MDSSAADGQGAAATPAHALPEAVAATGPTGGAANGQAPAPAAAAAEATTPAPSVVVFGAGGNAAHKQIRKKTVEDIWRELNARKSAAPLSRTTGVAGFGIPGVQTTTRTLPSRAAAAGAASNGGGASNSSLPAAALAAAAAAALAAVRAANNGGAMVDEKQQQHHAASGRLAAAPPSFAAAGAVDAADTTTTTATTTTTTTTTTTAAAYARAVSALTDQGDRAARYAGIKQLRAVLGLPPAGDADRADDEERPDGGAVAPPPPPTLRLLLSADTGSPPALPALVGGLADSSERCRSAAAELLTDAARRLPAEDARALMSAVAPALAARVPGGGALLRSAAAAAAGGGGVFAASEPVDEDMMEVDEGLAVGEEPAEEVRLQLVRLALALVQSRQRRRRPLAEAAVGSASEEEDEDEDDGDDDEYDVDAWLPSLAGVCARALRDPFPELKRAGCALVAALAQVGSGGGGGSGDDDPGGGSRSLPMRAAPKPLDSLETGRALAALVLAACAGHQHARVRLAAVAALDALATVRAPSWAPLALPAGDVEDLLAPGLAPLAASDRSPAVRGAAYEAAARWIGRQARAAGANLGRRAAALAPLLLLGCSDEQPALAARCASLLAEGLAEGLLYDSSGEEEEEDVAMAVAPAAAPGHAAVEAAGLGEPYTSFFAAAAAAQDESGSGKAAAAALDARRRCAACRRGVRALLPALMPRVARQLGAWTSGARLSAARELHAAVVLSWGLVGGVGGGEDDDGDDESGAEEPDGGAPPADTQLLRHRAASLAVAAMVRAAADDERDPAVLAWLRRSGAALAAFCSVSRAWLPLALDAVCGGSQSSSLMASLRPSAVVRGRFEGGRVRAPGVGGGASAGVSSSEQQQRGAGAETDAAASPAQQAAAAARRVAALQMLATGLEAARRAGQPLDLELAWAVAASLASEDVRALALGGAGGGAAAALSAEGSGQGGAAASNPLQGGPMLASRELTEAARAALLASATSLLRWARPLLQLPLGPAAGAATAAAPPPPPPLTSPKPGSAEATAEALYLLLLQVREAERGVSSGEAAGGPPAGGAGAGTAAADAALAELAAGCCCCCSSDGDGGSGSSSPLADAAAAPLALLSARYGPALMDRLLRGSRAWSARSPGFRAAGALLLTSDRRTLLLRPPPASEQDEGGGSGGGGGGGGGGGLFLAFARRAAASVLAVQPTGVAAAALASTAPPPELRLAMLALLDELLERQEEGEEAAEADAPAAPAQAAVWPAAAARVLVRDLLLPPLVWRVGKTAAAARFGAVTALATALARGVVPDEVLREMVIGGEGGGGGGGEQDGGGGGGGGGGDQGRASQLRLMPLLYGALDEEWYADVRRTACFCARKLAERADAVALPRRERRALQSALLKRLDADARPGVRAAAAAALEAVCRACFGKGGGAGEEEEALEDADAERLAAALALHLDDGEDRVEEGGGGGGAQEGLLTLPPVADACAVALESLVAAAHPRAVREALERARPGLGARAAAEADRILAAVRLRAR
jgi:hypothetical protein